MFRSTDKPGIFLPPIEIKEHPHKGYVCIAAQDIQQGELIERCPTIKFAAGVMKSIREDYGRTIISDYVFSMTRRGFTYWAMGYGGLYSHSSNPNARWTVSYHPNDRDTIDVRATKPISKGEEITHNYLPGQPEENLWFDPVE
jgi:uncharacterized protein